MQRAAQRSGRRKGMTIMDSLHTQPNERLRYNPEQLPAGGWSAYFEGAITGVARRTCPYSKRLSGNIDVAYALL
jgi:organic hydroperoxide reductase OsmC/OhrA